MRLTQGSWKPKNKIGGTLVITAEDNLPSLLKHAVAASGAAAASSSRVIPPGMNEFTRCLAHYVHGNDVFVPEDGEQEVRAGGAVKLLNFAEDQEDEPESNQTDWVEVKHWAGHARLALKELTPTTRGLAASKFVDSEYSGGSRAGAAIPSRKVVYLDADVHVAGSVHGFNQGARTRLHVTGDLVGSVELSDVTRGTEVFDNFGLRVDGDVTCVGMFENTAMRGRIARGGEEFFVVSPGSGSRSRRRGGGDSSSDEDEGSEVDHPLASASSQAAVAAATSRNQQHSLKLRKGRILMPLRSGPEFKNTAASDTVSGSAQVFGSPSGRGSYLHEGDFYLPTRIHGDGRSDMSQGLIIPGDWHVAGGDLVGGAGKNLFVHVRGNLIVDGDVRDCAHLKVDGEIRVLGKFMGNTYECGAARGRVRCKRPSKDDKKSRGAEGQEPLVNRQVMFVEGSPSSGDVNARIARVESVWS